LTVQLQKNKDFDEIIDRCVDKLGSLEEEYKTKKSEIIIDTAIELDEAGFEKSKISAELVERLVGFVDDSYVRKVLKDYPQYKDKKQQANAKSGRNIPAKPAQPDDRKPIEVPADKVSVTTNQQEKLVDVAEIAPNVLILEPDHQKSEHQMQQPVHQDEQLLPGMPEKFGVEYFEIEKLNTYPLEYCRKVIRWLDEVQEEYTNDAFKWDNQITVFAKENEHLKKQLEEAKPFIELLSLVTPESKERRLERLQSEIAALKERGLEE